MKNEIVKSAAQVTPPIGINIWQWVGSHDLNWWASLAVSIATLFYIGLQVYYLRKSKGKINA